MAIGRNAHSGSAASDRLQQMLETRLCNICLTAPDQGGIVSLIHWFKSQV